LLPLAVLASTTVHNRVFGLASAVLVGRPGKPGILGRALEQWQANTPEAVDFFADMGMRGQDFQCLPALFVVLLLLDPRSAWRLRMPLLALALTAAGLILAVIATQGEIDWQLRTTGRRLLLQVYPVIVLLSAVLMARWLPSDEAAAAAPPQGR
jgi:hypothetical protein